MSQTMNNQLTLQKAIYNKSNTSSMMLTRYGGKLYRSQSKNKKDNKNIINDNVDYQNM